MVVGIALRAIVTAAVTSSFVARARRANDARQEAYEQREQQHIDARFDEVAARLERVEALLRSLSKP